MTPQSRPWKRSANNSALPYTREMMPVNSQELLRLAFVAALLLPISPVPAADQDTEDGFSLGEAVDLPGVIPRLDTAIILQSPVSGDGDDDSELTGRVDLYVDFSSSKMGLWDGTLLRTHLEWRGGDDGAAGQGGALLPVNTAALLPVTGEGVELTSLYLVQQLGPATNLLLGKINAVDLLDSDPFFGGMGTKRFQNIAFVAPPSGVVPPTLMGAILTHQLDSVGITAMIFDPNDRTGDYWVDGLFDDGVNMSLGASWRGSAGGRATSIGLTGTFSTKRGTDFKDILLPPDVERSTKEGSFNIALQLGHLLAPSPLAPSKGLGIYAKAAIADGNPNFIQSSFIGGIAGHNLVPERPLDSFGIGLFAYDFSDELQDTVAPILDFNDETGIEAWYRLGITPNMSFIVDAQIIDPSRGDFGTAFSLGARLLLSL
jgi:porin